jgi:hypothetical protein
MHDHAPTCSARSRSPLTRAFRCKWSQTGDRPFNALCSDSGAEREEPAPDVSDSRPARALIGHHFVPRHPRSHRSERGTKGASRCERGGTRSSVSKPGATGVKPPFATESRSGTSHWREPRSTHRGPPMLSVWMVRRRSRLRGTGVRCSQQVALPARPKATSGARCPPC